MYKKETGNDKQGKDAGNRTLCPCRNFSQAIMTSYNSAKRPKLGPLFAVRIPFTQHAQMNKAFIAKIMTNFQLERLYSPSLS